MQPGQHAVAGRGVVEEDDVAGLLAAEGEAAAPASPPARSGRRRRSARTSMPSRSMRQQQAEVAHHGGHEGVLGQHAALAHGQGEDGHDLVAVDDLAGRVDGQAAVGVAVVGDAQRRRRARRPRACRLLQVRRPAAVVDVEAVRARRRSRRPRRRPARRPPARPRWPRRWRVDDDLQAVEPVRQRREQVGDVALAAVGAAAATRPTAAPVGRCQGSPQPGLDASSMSSASLWPPRAKNLMPLSGMGCATPRA